MELPLKVCKILALDSHGSCFLSSLELLFVGGGGGGGVENMGTMGIVGIVRRYCQVFVLPFSVLFWGRYGQV